LFALNVNKFCFVLKFCDLQFFETMEKNDSINENDVNIEVNDIQIETICNINDKIDDKLDINSNNETKDDVYSYTKRSEFTSETYKIEIRNLPKHIGYDVRL
jgi:hypothetical protein